MDIRAKVEARKAELQREQQRIESERKARNERAREAARVEVQKRVAVLESDEGAEKPQPPAVSVDEVPTEAEIERELDEALGKKAQDMWTSGENTTLLVLFFGGVASFFIFGWIVGLTLVIVSFVYLGTKNGKYKRQLRAELASRESVAGRAITAK